MLSATIGSVRRIYQRLTLAPRVRHELDETAEADVSSLYPPNVYGAEIPWEIPVQLCLRDLLSPGDCAFDVGANIGAVAIAMSRLVGVEGKVHAFEANPKTLPRLRTDLAANDVANVAVVPRAAWSVSGASIAFYCDNSYYAAASSVHRRNESWQEVRVPTITLDDYCRVNRLSPKAIKLDVEGAEFQVLQGASSLLDRCSPSFVLEYYPPKRPEEDPVELLGSRGYAIYDTNIYRRVDRTFYLHNHAKTPASNVVAISPGAAAFARYEGLTLVDIPNDPCRPGTSRTGEFTLPGPGRFIIATDFDGPPEAMAALRVIDAHDRSLAYFEARIRQLREHSCSHLVVDVSQPVDVRCELSSDEYQDIAFNSVKVTRIEFAQ